MRRERTQWMTEVALLAALITITGAIKLPGLLPGTEFQLSAPIAVAICTVFGFSKYMVAGLLSSGMGLILGTQNIMNVAVAMVFRLTVGGWLGICGTSWLVVVLAGPLGSAAARLALGGLIGKAAIPLLWAAVPGMIYTAATAWPITLMLQKIRHQTERVVTNAIQR